MKTMGCSLCSVQNQQILCPCYWTPIRKNLKSIKFVWQNRASSHCEDKSLEPLVSGHELYFCGLCFTCFHNLWVSFLFELRPVRLLVSSGTLVVISTSSHWQKSPGTYKNISGKKIPKLQPTEKYFFYPYRKTPESDKKVQRHKSDLTLTCTFY